MSILYSGGLVFDGMEICLRTLAFWWRPENFRDSPLGDFEGFMVKR
ncbi:MAG: hypothetical protein CM1200mP28_00530 [Deltaproteobacteria bacterium]|nr:MAG: hypothetical protein CM1200mP28_00530 [Deltaproteobacteria bacterium]